MKPVEKTLREIWKKNLEILSKTDPYYPTCCDAITKLMLREIRDRNLFPEHQVVYVRGHFITDVDCVECEDFRLNTWETPYVTPHCEGNDEIDCLACTCEEVSQHSYIELRKGGKRCVLDFSSYQFDEDFNSSYDTDPEQLMKMGLALFIEEGSQAFRHYFPSFKVIPLEDLTDLDEQLEVYLEACVAS